jgi:hypothetical protein
LASPRQSPEAVVHASIDDIGSLVQQQSLAVLEIEGLRAFSGGTKLLTIYPLKLFNWSHR